jgi:hypothetical protein
MDGCGHCTTFFKNVWPSITEELQTTDIEPVYFNQKQIERSSPMRYLCKWFPMLFFTGMSEYTRATATGITVQENDMMWTKVFNGITKKSSGPKGQVVYTVEDNNDGQKYQRTHEGVLTWANAMKEYVNTRFPEQVITTAQNEPSVVTIKNESTPVQSIQQIPQLQPQPPQPQSQLQQPSQQVIPPSQPQPSRFGLRMHGPSTSRTNNSIQQYETIGRFTWEVTCDADGNVTDFRRL